MPTPAAALRSFPGRLADLLWAPVNLLQFAFGFLWTAFWITVALLATLLTGSRRVSLWLARRVWARGLLAAGGARLRVTGREHLAGLPGALLVANHRSHLDIAALFAAVPAPLGFVAKRELAAVPFLGWYIRAMGMVFVDRADRRAAAASVEAAGALIARGRLLVTFPEGTRSRDGSLGPFKRGGFVAALAAGVPVVPVALAGTEVVMPPGRLRSRPGPVRVAFGAPISTAGRDPGTRAELARECEVAIAELLARLGARPA
ncbi:MAG: 1-acyl-sn-glycerol-3-phosphate acyltransferase [Thermoanaerobaculia bacterium]|nr:1-acyl-sn-glycerol-3-phosphate acyltransferase [Thermoanaerobaculia bacterium]